MWKVPSNIIRRQGAASSVTAVLQRPVGASSSSSCCNLLQNSSSSSCVTPAINNTMNRHDYNNNNCKRYKSSAPASEPSTPSPTSSTSVGDLSTTPPTTMYNKNMSENDYLNKILNSKVYEVAIETELQHAKNLSSVSVFFCHMYDMIRFSVYYEMLMK